MNLHESATLDFYIRNSLSVSWCFVPQVMESLRSFLSHDLYCSSSQGGCDLMPHRYNQLIFQYRGQRKSVPTVRSLLDISTLFQLPINRLDYNYFVLLELREPWSPLRGAGMVTNDRSSDSGSGCNHPKPSRLEAMNVKWQHCDLGNRLVEFSEV